MAIQKKIENTETGVSVSYHRITNVNVEVAEKRTWVCLSGYVSKSVRERDSGAPVMQTPFTFVASEDGKFSGLPDGEPIAWAYAQIAALEGWADGKAV